MKIFFKPATNAYNCKKVSHIKNMNKSKFMYVNHQSWPTSICESQISKFSNKIKFRLKMVSLNYLALHFSD